MIHSVLICYHRNSSDSTPLHLAAATGHIDVVAYLLQQPGIQLVQVGTHWSGLVHNGQTVDIIHIVAEWFC